jgi:hypothetical protein
METTLSCGGYVVSKSHLSRLEILVDRFSKTFKEHYHVTEHGKWYIFSNATKQTFVINEIYMLWRHTS